MFWGGVFESQCYANQSKNWVKLQVNIHYFTHQWIMC